MKRFVAGAIFGCILCLSSVALASPALRLIIDGVDVTDSMAAKPQVIDGYTMVPIRFVSEYLGAAVAWDKSAGHITISTSPAADPQYLTPLSSPENLTIAGLSKKYRTELDQISANLERKTITSSAGFVQAVTCVVSKADGKELYTLTDEHITINKGGVYDGFDSPENSLRAYLKDELTRNGYI